MRSERILPANGAEVCAQAFGGFGEPAVLLIGGMSSSMDWWEEAFCERLAARRRGRGRRSAWHAARRPWLRARQRPPGKGKRLAPPRTWAAPTEALPVLDCFRQLRLTARSRQAGLLDSGFRLAVGWQQAVGPWLARPTRKTWRNDRRLSGYSGQDVAAAGPQARRGSRRSGVVRRPEVDDAPPPASSTTPKRDGFRLTAEPRLRVAGSWAP